MSVQAAFHGSDFELVAKQYNIPREQIVSFSANVNPLGISPLLRKGLAEQIDAVMDYPDREYTALRAAIGQYTGADPDQILVGGGATELIALFIQNIAPKRAMLINPTYSEYAREIELSGGTLVSYQLQPERAFQIDLDDLCAKLDPSFDLLILCNPNNPTSSAIRQADLSKLLSHCKANGIYVMVDETYAEFAPDLEDITAVPLLGSFDNLLILRGVSKFFAAPGLRLGYGMTSNKAVLSYINTTKNPWTVNALAAAAGCAMFGDTDYIRRTRAFTHQELARLCGILGQERGLYVYPPSANFVLLRLCKEGLTSAAVFEHCIRKGLMVRDCASFPGLGDNHVRFCLNLPEQNDRLMAALKELL